MEKTLEKILTDYRKHDGNIISILQDIEDSFGFIPEDAVNWLSKKLGIPASRFFGIATFYSQFHLTQRGKNIVTACCGTACHVKGSEKLINSIRKDLGLPENEETTPDKQFTLERVNCVGACSIAPVIIINKKVHGKATTENMVKEIRGLKENKGESR